jgi:hypothetical protein
LLLILAFIELMTSSAFKSKICKPVFIQTLSQMIDNSESTRQSVVLDEFRRALFLVAE